jgi:glycosyl transferase, family 25
MVSDYFDRIFILHLPRSIKRRVLVLGQKAFLGTSNIETVRAVDGRDLDLDEMKIQGTLKWDEHLGRELTRGEVGCYLGHLGIWKEMLKRGCMRALVCEDDLIWRADGNEIMNGFMAEVPQDWDILHFHNGIRVGSGSRNDVKREKISNHVWRGYDESYGSACYALTSRAAQFLVKIALPIQSTIDGRTNWLTGWWKKCEGYKGYVCWPFPCEVAQVPSEIDSIELRPEVKDRGYHLQMEKSGHQEE